MGGGVGRRRREGRRRISFCHSRGPETLAIVKDGRGRARRGLQFRRACVASPVALLARRAWGAVLRGEVWGLGSCRGGVDGPPGGTARCRGADRRDCAGRGVAGLFGRGVALQREPIASKSPVGRAP